MSGSKKKKKRKIKGRKCTRLLDGLESLQPEDGRLATLVIGVSPVAAHLHVCTPIVTSTYINHKGTDLDIWRTVLAPLSLPQSACKLLQEHHLHGAGPGGWVATTKPRAESKQN